VGEGKIRYRYILPMKLRNKYTEWLYGNFSF
jgi:hypothetical protein